MQPSSNGGPRDPAPLARSDRHSAHTSERSGGPASRSPGTLSAPPSQVYGFWRTEMRRPDWGSLSLGQVRKAWGFRRPGGHLHLLINPARVCAHVRERRTGALLLKLVNRRNLVRRDAGCRPIRDCRLATAWTVYRLRSYCCRLRTELRSIEGRQFIQTVVYRSAQKPVHIVESVGSSTT